MEMSATKKNGNINGKIKLGNFTIDIEKVKEITSSASLPFLNPSDDFTGIIQPLSNEIRHIAKKGEMKQDIDVLDCTIIDATETREEEVVINGEPVTKKVKKEYKNEDYSLVLTKTVLLSRFKKLQEDGLLNNQTHILVIGLGKKEGKGYLDYYIDTLDNARKQGVVQ